jgi:hypothetical protein
MADPTFLNPISVLTQFDIGGVVNGGGGVSIDITKKVTENYPKIITTNPIESGSPTTDHMTNLPPRLQIQGGFSDLKLTNLTGTTINTLAGDPSVRNRAKNQFDRLLELHLSEELFTVMDGFHLFKDMQFSNLQLLKDREGFSVFFQADIQGIKIINLSPTNKKLLTEDYLERKVVANTTLLTVGSTVERDALESIGILA